MSDASKKIDARIESLDGNTRRAIDIHQDDELDEKAFTDLVRAAVDLNSQ